MNFLDRREEALPSPEQTSLPPLVISVGNHSAEDGLARDPDHRFSARWHLEVSRLQPVGTSLACTRLASGNVGKDVLVRENPAMARTFLNLFIKAKGNYPTTDFRTLGWVHSTKKQWWSHLTLYVLEHFFVNEAVRATCYGIEVGVPNFYALLELYCSSFGTFFTPVGELGQDLHEMWGVLKLPMGFPPYEEYFPCTAELEQLKTQDQALFKTYRKIMCHYHMSRCS